MQLTIFLGPTDLGEAFDACFADFQLAADADSVAFESHDWWRLEKQLFESLNMLGDNGRTGFDRIAAEALGSGVTVRQVRHSLGNCRRQWVSCITIPENGVTEARGAPVPEFFGDDVARTFTAALGLVLVRRWTYYLLGPIGQPRLAIRTSGAKGSAST